MKPNEDYRIEQIEGFVAPFYPAGLERFKPDATATYFAVYAPDPSRAPGERLVAYAAWSRKRREAAYVPFSCTSAVTGEAAIKKAVAKSMEGRRT